MGLETNKHIYRSLIATIKQARPDLLSQFPSTGDPIPSEMPTGFVDAQITQIEGIGQPVTASFFTLSTVDPTNWLAYPSAQKGHSLFNSLTPF